jgi:predicted solute-binding protein
MQVLVQWALLKKEISASINGGKIEKHTKTEILNAFHKAYEVAKKDHAKAVEQAEKQKAEDDKTISDIEARIAKMDKTSKSLNLGKMKITEGVENWIAQEKYVLEGNVLTIR